jgi:hypothetical protein
VNERGNFLLIVLALFLVVSLLPPLIMILFPQADLLMRIILALIIFTTVRGYIGDGIITILISGALIYVLVIKWAYLTASLYIIFYVFLTFSVFSVILWGLNSVLRR